MLILAVLKLSNETGPVDLRMCIPERHYLTFSSVINGLMVHLPLVI